MRTASVRYAEELQRLVGDAVAAEDHDPGVGPDEQARPERDHDEEDQGVAPPPPLEDYKVRQRIPEQEAQQRRQRRYPERADDDLQVQRVEDQQVVAGVEA
jgi:hypothetical protein